MAPLTAWRQLHDGNAHLMFETGIDNTLAAVDEIFDVVQGVEITNSGHPVFLEQFGMETDDVAGL